jgi:energy-coupling factor transporter ATP-binding protein EcfA2
MDQVAAVESDRALTIGARFRRVDFHVHTHADSDPDPSPDLAAYVAAAVAAEVEVLAITDHNHVRFVRPAMLAAAGTSLTVIPGIEVSTHDGHLLALFDPEHVEELEAFAHVSNLQLKQLTETEFRSSRSLLHLVDEIARRGGLAIPAHVDASNGMVERLRPAELTELLCSPGLAGLEFGTHNALSTWFSDDDDDNARRSAWRARQEIADLRERGLGRLMSSDAHRPDKIGRDRTSRTLTRLRLDDVNFDAIRNAIVYSPKARCKAEAILPATYPRIVRADFEGGFLDGVSMEFSPNLNCLIGGRGSGKSTALLAIRAALGAPVSGEDADAEDRMPNRTVVEFVDSAGSQRRAARERGQRPVDASGAPIRLRLADLGQEESGRLARGYNDDPVLLLTFLDGFVVRHKYDEAEDDLLASLSENAAEVTRTAVRKKHIDDLIEDRDRIQAALKAAQESRVEEIARWATLLASQGPLLDDLRARIETATGAELQLEPIDIDELAVSYGVDLSAGRAAGFVEGEDGLRRQLDAFSAKAATISKQARDALDAAAREVRRTIEAWKHEHDDLQARLAVKRTELEAQGLKVQADAVSAYATRLENVKAQLTALQRQRIRHSEALKERARLLTDLHSNRERLFRAREATVQSIATQANRYSDELTIRVYYERGGVNGEWIKWLTSRCGFKEPRVQRIASAITPYDFAMAWKTNQRSLLNLVDPVTGQSFFAQDLPRGNWEDLFLLQTMRCEDLPRIEVQRRGDPERHHFDRLSTGQQRSVLLSLLLCAERSEPLVLDQPEDHLDGQYIAGAVVRHLEAAKEHRQVLIATHSANLVVLGDAELVVPLRAVGGRGGTHDVGAVDHPQTRDETCALLEGGAAAFRKRGQRYGMRFVT